MHKVVQQLGIVDKYRQRLPIAANVAAVSLGEGNTPLLYLANISRELADGCHLYVKYEGLNPTASFKDRGMSFAMTKAVEEGAESVICASTGNTSAAAAAYAARANLRCFVIIPEGQIAMGKLAQAMMYGAEVLQIQGNFDEGLRLVREVASTIAVTVVNSINPYRLQGQKTAAFEVVEQLGTAPHFHALPVGNAGNISAYWMGYSEYYADKTISKPPRMLGYQASGAAPFIHGHAIENPETVATAIRIGDPQSWDKAQQAVDESDGWFDHLSDAEILATQQLLARKEGIFCEPASAVSLAGVLRDIRSQRLPKGSTIVCTLTGHGLKDPQIAIEQCADRLIRVDGNYDSLARIICS